MRLLGVQAIQALPVVMPKLPWRGHFEYTMQYFRVPLLCVFSAWESFWVEAQHLGHPCSDSHYLTYGFVFCDPYFKT